MHWSRLAAPGSGRAGILAIAGGSAFAVGLSMAVAPILTRVYSVRDFALLAVYSAGVMTVGAVASWRYELAISVATDEESAFNLLALSMLLVLVTTSATLVVLLLLTDVLASIVPGDEVRVLTWLLPVGLLAFGIYQTLTYWALRVQAYSPIARTKVSQSGVAAVTQVTVPTVQAGSIGLLLGDLFGRSVGSSSLIAVTLRPRLAGMRSVSGRAMIRVAREYWRFPIFLSSGAVVNAAAFHIPSIVILAMYGTSAGGWFALTQRVLAVPMTVLGQAVAHVYFGRVGHALREHRTSHVRVLFDQAAKKLALVAAGPTLALIAFAPDLFALAFGAAWRPAGQYAQLMAAMLAAQLVVSPISQTLTLLGLQQRQFALDVGRLAVVSGGFVAAAALHLPALSTIAVYVGTMLIYYIAVYFVCKVSILSVIAADMDNTTRSAGGVSA